MSRLSYFNYVNSEMSPSLITAIHETIQENKRYAQVVWKSRFEDAIDATLHHAMKYYSPDKGELRNYIVSTIKNILTNSFKKEQSTEDETLNFLVDSNENNFKHNEELEEVITDFTEEVSECILDFLPYLVDDFEFFSELAQNKMKNDYSDILSKYSSKSVVSALHSIQSIYLPKVSEFVNSESCGKIYNKDVPVEDTVSKYSSPIDFVGRVQRTALVKGYSPKEMFLLNLKDLAEGIFRSLYSSSDSYLRFDFEGRVYYRTPCWSICSSREELISYLENFCLNFLCKRLGYVVVSRDGDFFYLLGSSSFGSIQLFNRDIHYSMVAVPRKEVVC